MLRVGRWPLLVNNETRLPGEPIPEALQWKNLRAYIDTGRVVEDRSDSVLCVGRAVQVDGITRLPGELIPEASTWSNLHSYLETGHIVYLDQTSSGGAAHPSGRPAPSQGRLRRTR